MVLGVRSIVKFRKVSIALTLGIVACAALSLAAQKKAAQTSGPVVFAQDKGKFTIKLSGSLTLQADGAPISYDWSAQTEKTNGAHILFANGVASITLEMQGARPFQQDLTFNSPLIAVLDNNLYHQYA